MPAEVRPRPAADPPARCVPRAGRRQRHRRARHVRRRLHPGGRGIGMPGVGPADRSGSAATSRTSGRAGIRATSRTGRRSVDARARQRVARPRQTSSGGGVYEHGDPGGTAGPGCSGVPSSTGGAGGGAPLGNRVPFGSGNRNAGRPALRQNFSGSMPRFLNAASTHGCRIWYGSRLTSITLKYGPDADRLTQATQRISPTSSARAARSSLRSTRMSLTVRSCSSTWFRFGLSLIKPSPARRTRTRCSAAC